MIITAYGQYHPTPPHTEKQAEEFMVSVDNPFWLRVKVANSCPANNLEILKAVVNSAPETKGTK